MTRRSPTFALFLTAAAAAQGWTPLGAPAWRYEHPPVVTDFARQRLVLVDETGTTWEWDGSHWREVGLAVPYGSIVYHAGRARTLLVAYTTTSVCLEWDGHAWTPVPNAVPAPGSPVMAYDTARQRLVAIDYQGQLWEWDGAAWTSHGTVPAAAWANLVYDSTRQQLLMFSHANINTPMQTHAWNGTAWQLLASTGPTNPHYGCADDPVRGRIVLHGGGGQASTAATWEWDGVRWQQIPGASAPSRRDHVLAFDPVRGQVLLFGGNAGTTNVSGTATMQEVFAWNGTTWTRIAASAPPSRILYAAHYDLGRERFVLSGGRVAGTDVGDLWEFDGVHWEQRFFTGGPSAREGHGLATAPGGGSLLFGGYDGQYRDDCWLWNGSSWAQLAGPAPTPRAGHGMATDLARNRVVVHGGSSAPFAPLADTWEWDGVSWTQVATNGPSVFFGSICTTYDPVAGGVLVQTTPLLATGTWLWDGTAWSNVAVPLANRLLGLGFDPVRGTTLAITQQPSGFQFETWMRTGTTWTPVPGLVRPVRGPYDGSALCALEPDRRGRVLHYGGTFLSALPTAPAAAEDVGPACGDPAVATPFVTSFGLPRIGDLGYRLALRAGPQRAGILGFATRPAPQQFGRCTWHLDLGPQLIGVTDGAGLGELPMALLPHPSFYGLDVFVQFATLEPNAAVGFTFSASVRLHLGD